MYRINNQHQLISKGDNGKSYLSFNSLGKSYLSFNRGKDFFLEINLSETKIACDGHVLTDWDKMSNFIEDLPQMLPTKFRFIWPSGFRGEDLKLEAQVSLYRSPDINKSSLRMSACRIHLSYYSNPILPQGSMLKLCLLMAAILDGGRGHRTQY